MPYNLTGTWVRDNQDALSIMDNNGQLTFKPASSDSWWSSGHGSWNQGEGGGDGAQAPFLGIATFTNNAGQSYTCNFCLGAGGRVTIYSNGVFLRRKE